MNLETSTESDREAIAHLTATVTRLIMELTIVNEKLTVTLREKRTSHCSHGGRDKAARRRGAVAVAGDGAVAGAGAAEKIGSGAPALVAMVRRVDLDPPIHY